LKAKTRSDSNASPTPVETPGELIAELLREADRSAA
jgi:hypothetical protein